MMTTTQRSQAAHFFGNPHTDSCGNGLGAEALHTAQNPARLGQVVLQLLHNAAKFTEEGGITLSWRILPKQKQIMICITDTGIGIPQDKQEFVFERFAKLDTFSKGTGLGLALSRLIMERMGGNLVLDAQYTDGCRFMLTLPI